MSGGFELGDRAEQALGERAGVAADEGVGEGAVVPEGAVAMAGEARPDGVADPAVVLEDGRGVVQLVGEGDEERVRVLGLDRCYVGFLAGAPWRLRDGVGVRATASSS
jgi:hypothetical protein